MGHCVPDWHGDFDPVFKPVDMPMSFKQVDMPMSKQGFAMSKELANSPLDPLSDFGDLPSWQEHGGMIESTKGLWSESMDGDGIAPVRDEFRMGGLEGDMQQQEQHGNNVLAAQQAKEAQDELESWLQYPVDESMDTDYCAEGFGNLPTQPVAVQAYKDSFASGLTTTRFVRPNPFGNQSMQTGSQNHSRAANSAAALAEGAARVSGLLPTSLPEALSRVRTQAQSSSWATAPVPTGPTNSVSARNGPLSEKAAVVSSQGGGACGAAPAQTAPPVRQQVYPSIFDRSRLAAAATRVGAGTKLKAKEAKKPVQPRPAESGKPAQLETGVSTQNGVESKEGKQSPRVGVQGQGKEQNGGGEQSLPSPTSNVTDSKTVSNNSNPLPRQGSHSGGQSVSQPDSNPPPPTRFGGDKTLEERQREFQAELSRRQAETSASLQRQQMMLEHRQQEMQRWNGGQISPVQLPPDRPRAGFKQIQPKPSEGGGYEGGFEQARQRMEPMACYPPQAFLQQHAAAAEAMRSGRHSMGMEAGPSGQEGSASLSGLTQERMNGSMPGATHVPSVRAPACAWMMQRGGARAGPLLAKQGGGRGKERSSQGSRPLETKTLAGGRDSVNETTVTSSYSEGDSLATSRAYQKSPMIVGRKRDRCAKSDTEALDEENDTLTEGTWATEDGEGRPKGKEKGKRTRAAEVHNQSERRRRDRINDRMRALQELIPNSNKTDKASVLDEAIEYLKNLQTQLQFMSMRTGLFAASLPPGASHSPSAPGMPNFPPLPVHPPSAHLPPMSPMHYPPSMHFMDHPPFAKIPSIIPEEGSEMKPGRPFGEHSLEMYSGHDQRSGGMFHPVGSRMDLYEGYSGPQPPPSFDQGRRK